MRHTEHTRAKRGRIHVFAKESSAVISDEAYTS